MDLARYVDDFEIDLEEEDHEGDGERRQRVAFNQRRKLPMLVAQLHGLGERASSSATRPTWVLPPEPPVELDERATTWEAWCCEAVHDIQGWVNAGCDVSEVIQAIADLILARGIEAYTRHGLECLESLREAAPRGHGARPPVGCGAWASTMEAELFYGCSGLAASHPPCEGNAEGEEEDAAITGEEEDDVMALPSIKVDKKWLKPVDRRRRDRRRGRGELTRKARPTPKVASSGRVTNEVRKLRPTAKKCPFLRKETPRLEERSGPARAREPPPRRTWSIRLGKQGAGQRTCSGRACGIWLGEEGRSQGGIWRCLDRPRCGLTGSRFRAHASAPHAERGS